MLGMPIYMLAKARQEELLAEAEATRGYHSRADRRSGLSVRLMVQVATLLIRVGLDLLERYEPTFSIECDTCQTVIGKAST